MRQANKRIPDSAEKTVRDIRRATRRHHSAEEKIRIVLEVRDVGNGAMVEPLRHRQTKEAATDMFDLQPPRHIPTLPNPVIAVMSAA
jgi:hypothetical protein